MSVFDLHPEDLLEREELGELTPAERALLDAHLAQCAACRFERLARADFAAELGAMPVHDGALVTAAIDAAAKKRSEAAAEPPAHELSAGAPEPRSIAPRRRAAPRRAAAAILVAASFLLATASFAAVRNGTLMTVLRAAGIVAAAPEGVGDEESAPPAAPPRAKRGAAAPAKSVQVTEAPETAQVTEQAEVEKVSAPEPIAPPAPVPAPPAAPRTTVPSSVAPTPTPTTTTTTTTTTTPSATTTSPRDAAAVFAEAGQARRRGDHAAAVRAYRELLNRHPGSPEAASARVAFGRLLLDDGEPVEALSKFQAYLDGGDGSLREEAMVGRARALMRLGRSADERRAWTMLLQAYPESVHAERARARLAELDSR